MKQTETAEQNYKPFQVRRTEKQPNHWEYVYDRKTGQPVPRLVGAGR